MPSATNIRFILENETRMYKWTYKLNQKIIKTPAASLREFFHIIHYFIYKSNVPAGFVTPYNSMHYFIKNKQLNGVILSRHLN